MTSDDLAESKEETLVELRKAYGDASIQNLRWLHMCLAEYIKERSTPSLLKKD